MEQLHVAPLPETANLLIPTGLLRRASTKLYNYSCRDVDSPGPSSVIENILVQPSEAILTNRIISQRRAHSLHDPTQPYLGRGFEHGPPQNGSDPRAADVPSPTSIAEHKDDLESNSRTRAHSVNVAHVLRRNARHNFHAEAATPPLLVHSRSSTPTKFHRQLPEAIKEPTAAHTHDRLSPHQPVPPLHSSSPPRRTTHDHGQFGNPFYVQRSGTVRSTGSSRHRMSILRKASVAIADTVAKVIPRQRKTSILQTYEKAKLRQKQLQRSKPFQFLFQYTVYLLLLAFVYLVLVGRPLWGGTVWYLYLLFEYRLTFVGGSAIFLGLAFFYAFGPLLILFDRPAKLLPQPIPTRTEQDFPPAPFVRVSVSDSEKQGPEPLTADMLEAQSQAAARAQTALLIPCYKSAALLPATLSAALRVFPASNIFVLANGNSPTPLDNTEQVCDEYGVNHVWIPVGSKLVAQYVGGYVARHLPYCLLIDDDCLLPPEIPIEISKLQPNPRTGKPSRIKVLGYTLASTGANGSNGTWCQQAQDVEYKLSGLQRQFAGKIGSATFPHGAIALWETEFLIRTFKRHPGFSVSEDWFFGHVARELGSRITMCSSVFVQTETPSAVFLHGSGERGGFGEMTVFKQRFKRWNFFFVNGLYYNLSYILFSWRLGFREIGTKLFVFQEVYETILYLITPLVLPVSFIVRPAYTAYLFAATLGLYLINTVIFNELHLRLVNRQVNRWMLVFYYMPFKLALTFVNVASSWWSLWQYAKYFAQRHPRVVDSEKVVGVVLKLEEDKSIEEEHSRVSGELMRSNSKKRRVSRASTLSGHAQRAGPRRMTLTAMRVDIVDEIAPDQILTEAGELVTVQPIEGAEEVFHGRRSGSYSGVVARDFAHMDTVVENNEEGMYGYSFYGV